MRISDWSSDVCSSDLTVMRAETPVQGRKAVCDAAQIDVAAVLPDMAEGGGAILAGEGGRLACEARIKFLARLTVQKLIEAQRFEQMTPAAPIDLSRHLRREMIARGHLDLAVRIAVPILMFHFREKGARQAGVAIAEIGRAH